MRSVVVISPPPETKKVQLGAKTSNGVNPPHAVSPVKLVSDMDT